MTPDRRQILEDLIEEDVKYHKRLADLVVCQNEAFRLEGLLRIERTEHNDTRMQLSSLKIQVAAAADRLMDTWRDYLGTTRTGNHEVTVKIEAIKNLLT